ncbi:MAG: hypothetical protein IT162_16580 [Bryobacterales bacterium]|nr:hypothetical protein [Bryobacterales bacterium]
MEPHVRWETNQDGERGGPVPGNREGLYRVLVAGGSAVECGLLDQDSAWPAVVEHLLNEPEALERLAVRQAHVGNIGRSLLPVGGIRTILERTLPRYDKLDLAVLMVGSSDAIEWLELGTPAVIPTALGHQRLFGESPEVTFGWSPKRTALWRVAARQYRRVTGSPRVRRNGGSRFIELRQRRRNARNWISELPSPEPMLAQMEKDFRAVVRLLRSRGTRVLILRQPWIDRPLRPEEDAMMWNFFLGRMNFNQPADTFYTHDAVQKLFREVDCRIARLCRELNLESVNLMPRLESSMRTYYDFQHFTPEGARQVALHTTEAILAHSPEQRAAGRRSEPAQDVLEHTAP